MVLSNNNRFLPNSNQNQMVISTYRQALPQVLAVCVKNVLLVGFGMTLGFPTILIPSLSGQDANEKFHLDQEAISWIGSINLICVPVGCFLSGPITQPLGRRRAMQLVNVPFLIAWLLFYFSTEVWHIFIALCLTGLGGGLSEAPVLTYVAEVTQPHLRGMLSATSTMSVTLGILWQFLLGTFLNWRHVVLLNCVVPFISFTLLMFIPETPVWLLYKNRHTDAKKSLAWLRGWVQPEDVDTEFKILCKQLGKTQLNENGIPLHENSKRTTENEPVIQKPSKTELVKLFTKKSFLWPYFLVCFAFFLSYFNGPATLQTFAIPIFQTLKAPINKYYATVILGAMQLIGCIVCVTLVNFLGKRIINFISLAITAISFIIVATYAHLHGITNLIKPNSNATSIIIESQTEEVEWVPVTFLILAAFGSYLGIRILPWILTGEVFSNETRATASGLSAAAAYVFGFISNKIFLSLVNAFTLPGVFWFYGALSIFGIIMLYFIMPETEGKTLHEITQHFAGGSKIDNKVARRDKANGLQNPAFSMDEEKRVGNASSSDTRF